MLLVSRQIHLLRRLVAPFATLLVCAQAHADGPLGRQGAPIQTSAYTIDMFTGPVLASVRPTGLAGAYNALAEGVDGLYGNPAATAVRFPWSSSFVDYDLDFGFTTSGTLKKTDFDNNGTPGFANNDFLFATLGATLQFGEFGVGLTVSSQRFNLGRTQVGDTTYEKLSVALNRARLAAGYSFWQGQLVVGAGVRLSTLAVTASSSRDVFASQQDLFSLSNGAGLELGTVWAPPSLPLRTSVAVRSRASATVDEQRTTLRPNDHGDVLAGQFYLPQRIEQPWEAEAGVAFQVGPRPLNVPWTNPDKEAERWVEEIQTRRQQRRDRGETLSPAEEKADEERIAHAKDFVRKRRKEVCRRLPRERLLLLTSLLVSGSVDTAVGFESFLQRTVDRSGQKVTLSPRLGAETELVPHWFQLRAGSYLEPSRFAEGSPRIHATAGFDARLFSWSVFGLYDDDTAWRVRGSLDTARDYVSFGGSVGVWY